MQYFDFHTHNRLLRPDVTAIVCMGMDGAFERVPHVSVGLHPWDVTEGWAADVERLRQLSLRPEVLCIGECGLDRLRPNWSLQLPAFVAQLELARELGKPVVVHCVRAVDELLAVQRDFKDVRMVVHGFRSKPQQAVQLLGHGIGLSFGPQFNADSLRVAFEKGEVWLETDDSAVAIDEVYERASRALSISPTDIPVPGTAWF